ncbi:OmpA family protein [Siccirubricoccus sp. KC 17139]|uniref:OmpA family protein n=1 Tax=Siccirubricoccus soli TaxID=2899147 RepID=A0ABT1DCA3_9PROT|nr:OmpA family protein [Siccirubricoccus soli]MCO6419570.1 OmpA family protein [Siccirubricoccus soli]MCP2685705.1 OmpA family protein [Siccirubricoccus soli]
MNLKQALLAATVLALPLAAQAQPVSGLYVGAGAGLNLHQESTGNANGVSGKTKYENDGLGGLGLASIGWGFGNGLRAEVEGNFRQNGIERTTGPGGARVASGGYLNNYGVMVNAFYDFQLGGPISPYLGVGVGYGWVEAKNIRIAGTTVHDTDSQFAYQGIAGAAYSLGAYVPGLYLTGEYRFYGTLDPEFRTAGVTVKGTNYNHSVLLGVRYAFNAPRPAPVVAAPPVAPAPTVARTYLVFFDWDRADLTDRARQIIGEAAAAAPQVQTTRIEVAGHADRSGTPQYNQRLSQRRADAVAAELVRRGIARNLISVTAYGESRPLVPTADGVREPQNRRVEIVLR